jgi:hypothetical protein
MTFSLANHRNQEERLDVQHPYRSSPTYWKFHGVAEASSGWPLPATLVPALAQAWYTFGANPVDAWAAIYTPEGWTEDCTQRLRDVIGHEE